MTHDAAKVTDQEGPPPQLSRRAFLRGALGAGLVAASGACGATYTLAL